MNGFRVDRSGSPVPEQERARILTDPGFGRYFTDHMASATWTMDAGWQDCRIKALEPYSLHPAAAVLHYAQEIFEGLKAMRHADGSIWLFRPELNARRFARSARRLALPVLPEETFVDSLVQLVAHRRGLGAAVRRRDSSLYLRPYMFGSEAFLGVRPAVEVNYCGDRLAGRVRTSPPASRGSRSGSASGSPGPHRAAPARPSAAATTPAAWPPSWRRSSTAASRCSTCPATASATWRSPAP